MNRKTILLRLCAAHTSPFERGKRPQKRVDAFPQKHYNGGDK